MPAPCFGQEFAPTSVAFAETQSMFLDSLLNDADWQQRYAKNAAGEAIPWSLIEEGLRARQPFAAWTARAMLAVCYAEKAIYELPEDELTPERVLEVLRAEETRLLFLDEGSPRPVLAVPHLLAGESSAYYHGYVMAEMGVHQTREFFLERDGFLTDNPKIGPALAESYWRPGNSMGCSPMVERLTGVPLGAAALAKHVNRSVDEALEAAKACAERGRDVPTFADVVDLEAHVSVVHGRETVAVLEPGGDFDAFAGTFATWIAGLAAASS
jgi:Zn-dependent oligopeptidase